ncbi:segregation/condensation protein A [Pontibacillus litoralis]|uniref:Segregation and condensation protein A n=1 Tax=Pontibacillus litoralis JSM 072002 TaxID=1385512 RepID=A0A0A5G4F0_9BACI|nr:segregation/condensation protein A [Pontibacillus litoralis]KGX85965.1 segregation and condensation protein A [Pontibacillus litoralis JSM 072002]
MNLSYTVKLDAFEGPLDLLLHLINRYEIDIYDIPVATITEQYMAYIHTMQQLELNVASEYLVMAATLIAIKSQMLLPNQEPELEEEYAEHMEEDPRDELMRRLIEYRKYKEAAHELQEREMSANQIFTRPPQNFEKYQGENASVANDGEVTIYDMISAMQKLLQKKKWQKPLETKVQRQEIPIQSRMEEVMTHINEHPSGVDFFALFPVPTRRHIVVTFIAILELMKNRSIMVEQKEQFETFTVYKMEE